MNTPPKILTIIICTYNRNEILRLCLEALSQQKADVNTYDILIVNNYNNQRGQEEITSLIQNQENITLVSEPNPGLSIARNRGAQSAQSTWVAYIDDDCLVAPNFVEVALKTIAFNKYDCFGGHITSWWLGKRPRWLDKTFGTKPILSPSDIELKEDYNWGGNIFFDRNKLLEVGGFDDKVGMIENKIGYSAENRVQISLRNKGYKIGYIPSLEVAHLVAEHKMRLGWHIKAAYAEGRDAKIVFPDQYTLAAILKDFFRIPKQKAVSFIKWITVKDYYFENMLLDILKPTFKALGKVFAK